jgi:hypothetical protein
VAHPNPVRSDANGRFDRIFMDPSVGYKVVLTDSDDNVIWTEDNVYANSLGQDDLIVRIQNAGNSPLDYGAVGDGVADETSFVQAAIDGASKVVDLCGKTYRCDNTITLADGRILKNGTLDFSNCTDSIFVRLLGDMETAVLLTGELTAGDTDIYPASMSGIAVGQTFNLRSDATWTDTANKHGELVDVLSVESTYFVTTKPIKDDYATADSSSIRQRNTYENIVLRDVTIYDSAPSGTSISLYLRNCRHVAIERCTISGVEIAGVMIDGCDDVEISNCVLDTGKAAAEGIQIMGCSKDVHVHDCRIVNIANGIKYGVVGYFNLGPCRDILIENCQVGECGTAGIVEDVMVQNAAVINCDTDNQNAALDVTGSNVGSTGEADQTSAIQGRGAEGQDVANRYGGVGGKFVGGDAGGSASTYAGAGVEAHGGDGGASGTSAPGLSAVGGTGAAGIEAVGGTGAAGIESVGGTDGIGVDATGDGDSVGVEANADTGPAVHIKSNSSTVSSERVDGQATPSGAGLVGDRYTDTAGRVRTCRVAGTPGTFRAIGALQTRQVLTGSGTYTTPAGVTAIMVTCYGAGGGGAASNAGGAGQLQTGGGGASGGRSQKLIVSPSATYPYACGSSGAGGTIGGGVTGGTGGDTTFNTSTVVAKGGTGGLAPNTWSAAATTGFVNRGGITATTGGAGDTISYGSCGGFGFMGLAGESSGEGASSDVGSGGNFRTSSGNGYSAVRYASGGGGAASLNEAVNRDGGPGGPGIIIVDEYY